MEKSYLKGILGALLGGIIATIPWVLAYAYLNIILSVLAIIVAIFALKGYQLFNGKIDKRLPIIITIVSLISITVATLIIIPCLLILKEDLPVTIANLKMLYSNSEFVTALIGDYAISILFTFLGISGVVTTLKNQTKNNQNLDNVKFDLSNGNNKKDKQKVKDLFLSKNAITEDNAIPIDSNLDINMNTLNLLITQEIIIKKDDKFYYSVQDEEKTNKKNKKIYIITIIVVALLTAIFTISGIMVSNEDANDTNNNTVVKDVYYNIPDTYMEYIDEREENSWYYLPKEDLSGYSGYFLIYYFDSFNVYSEDWIESTKHNFESYEGVKSIKSTNHFKNNYNYDVVVFDLEFDEYDDTIYYIFGNKEMAVVEVVDYDVLDKLQTDGKNIVKEFRWIDEINN